MIAEVHALQVTTREAGVRFGIRVKPRASREGLEGVREGALQVSVAAAPVDGQANEAVVKALASALGVHRRDVKIVAGETGRQKIVEISGLSESMLRARLEGA